MNPLAGGAAPAWATAWGEDRHGVFAAFAVAGVSHRMRWVPPGRFTMGSPDGEKGRWDGEGPQHEVVLSEGYWLGETPVTQALWAAVMGTNPSRFQSGDRPVEQVSWEDCMDFLRALGAKVPLLEARLPTEAEWEHGCRGGTPGATWAGELEILGEHHAPVLDAIAWYGGNSGKDFDLPDGYDSSAWPNKQYPHTRAGTRPVGQKAANPFGLYDMLGNVWEWCSDWYAGSDGQPAVDPTGPTSGSLRVLRGGSWYNQAGFVRAASRGADAPGYHSDFLGFRLARGPSAHP